MTADMMNAAFETAGATLTWMNVRRVWEARGYEGIYMPAVALFTSWGVWNLFYYSHLVQWWSVSATVWMVAANTSWLSLMAKFGRIQRVGGMR